MKSEESKMLSTAALRWLWAVALSAVPATAQPASWTALGLQDLNCWSVAVAPGRSDTIFVGGNSLAVTTDGGASWSIKSAIGDVRAIALGTDPDVVFVGSASGGVYRSVNGGATWDQKVAGLGSYLVQGLRVSPADGSVVYAATESGLYRSRNRAESWVRVCPTPYVGSVVVVPQTPQTLYVGTGSSGVLKSTNGGLSWAPLVVGTVPAGAPCTGLAVDASNPDVVYALFLGGGAWVSQDAGATWAQIQPPFEEIAIAADPWQTGVAYAVGGWATPKRTESFGSPGWDDLAAGWDASWFSVGIAMDPNDPRRVYACSPQGGLLRWVSDAALPDRPIILAATAEMSGIRLAWNASGSAQCAGYRVFRRAGAEAYPGTPLAVIAGVGNTSYFDPAVTGGIPYHYKVAAVDAAPAVLEFSNEADAEAWLPDPHPEMERERWIPLGPSGVNCRVVAAPVWNGSLLLAGGDALYVSSDAGATWAEHADIQQVWSIAFGPVANTIYVGTWNSGGVFKSTDGGASWQESRVGLPALVIKEIAPSPVDSDTVYAGTERGVCRSVDGGLTWMPVGPDMDVSALVVLPQDPGTVFSGSWGNGVWKSTDGGGTWTQLTVGSVPTGAGCMELAADPLLSNVVYAILQGQAAWVTRDGGATWGQIDPQFEGLGVATDPQRSGMVYAVGGWSPPRRAGVFGASGWSEMATGWDPGWFARGITVDPNDAALVYACSPEGGVARWLAETEPPDRPTALTATAELRGIRLAWLRSDADDCIGYLVYRRADGEPEPIVPWATALGRETTSWFDTQVQGGRIYHYRVAAVDAAQNRSALSGEASALALAYVELDVTYIERLPRDTAFYQVDYPDGIPTLHPGTESAKRRPALGETVTFVAHFLNRGSVAANAVNYRWLINGVVAGAGTIAGLEAGQEGHASLDWSWNVPETVTTHADQTVKFELDFDEQAPDVARQNNALTDYLGGLSFYIWVEPALYQAMNSRLNLVGTFSFEDWLQAQIREMNEVFARSTYPLAPDGALERVRVDRIILGAPPGDLDPVPDGRWYLSGGGAYADTFALGIDGGLLHELMHQIGLIDLYVIDAAVDQNRVTTPDGLPQGASRHWGRAGLMGGGDVTPHTGSPAIYLSQHDVVALNSNVGYRRGYYGEYLYDIPQDNEIVVLDSSGQPAAGVQVRVFQTQNTVIPNAPIMTGFTDPLGRFALVNRSVVRSVTTATGHTLRPNPFGTIDVVGGNAILLIELARPGGDFDYAWLDITQFNLAYHGGHPDAWSYTVSSRLAASPWPRVSGLCGSVAGNQVSIEWSPVAGATAYRVYLASSYLNQPDDPEHRYENWVFRPVADVATPGFTKADLAEPTRLAVAAVGADGKEGPLSARFFAPVLWSPQAVAVRTDNTRIVLDPQGSPALLQQAAGGDFVASIGSVHYHLEFTRFMAVDRGLGRLVFSHPGDHYTDRHSVRVADLNANPEIEFGFSGAGPGDFSNPTGVAVDAEHRIYVVDSGNNRVQIFTSDGVLLAVFGTGGSGPGEFFDAQGIAVDSLHRVYVCDRGNRRVQVLQFDGVSVTYLGALPWSFGEPFAVAIGTNGRIYVSDTEHGTVEAFSDSGNWVATYRTPTDGAPDDLFHPTGVAVGQLGELIVADTGNRRIVTIRELPPPTAAELAYFRAITASGTAVALVWGTLVEVDCLGFRLERLGADGAWQLVTSETVPGQGGVPGPHAYQVSDAEAAGGLKYRLIGVDRRGGRSVLAEATVEIGVTLRAEVDGAALQIECRGQPMRTAVLESAKDPVQGPWEEVASIPLDAAGVATVTRPLADGEPMRFFRVRE